MKAIGRRQSVFVGALTLAVSVSFVAPIGAQDSSSPAALLAQRGQVAESILAAKERAMGEPFGASIRTYLKTRMEGLPIEQLEALTRQGEAADVLAALGSVTSDLVYTPVTPCRAFDSRVSQGGPGPIPANTQRNVFVAGTVGFEAQGGLAGGCGVPVGATSAIINFVTVLPAGPGNIRAWAVAVPQPLAPLAAVMNYGSVAGLPAIANGVAVPLCNPAATDCTLGDLRLQADTNSTDILGDVVGYFGATIADFVDLTTAQTVGGTKTFSSPIEGSVTGSAASVTGVVPISNGGTGSATQNFVDLNTTQTVGGSKTFSAEVSAPSLVQNGNSVCDAGGNCPVTGIVPIANGGTGSATQNFVDLTTPQTVGGTKTLTGNLVLGASTSSTTGNIMKGGSPFIHNFGGSTFVGVNAGNFTMSGGAITVIGQQALQNNTSGSFNTAAGLNALNANTTGGNNTAIGGAALGGNVAGDNNTATGTFAAGSTTGTGNTAMGAFALLTNTTGNNNTAVGFQAGVSTNNLTNATAIGNGATVDVSNKIRLGNSAVTVLEAQVGLTVASDRTRKENFREVNAQEVLQKLRRISVTSWNYIGHDSKEFRHYGPMAQDFFAAFGNDGVGAIGTDTTINSSDLTAILMIGLKGLDEQSQKDQRTIAAQAEEIASLKQQTQRIAELEESRQTQAAQLVALKERVARIAELELLAARVTAMLQTLAPPSVPTVSTTEVAKAAGQPRR